MPFGVIGRTVHGMRQVVRFGHRSTGRGTFGANLECAIVTNGAFTANVCDSAGTPPSSQITSGRLINQAVTTHKPIESFLKCLLEVSWKSTGTGNLFSWICRHPVIAVQLRERKQLLITAFLLAYMYTRSVLNNSATLCEEQNSGYYNTAKNHRYVHNILSTIKAVCGSCTPSALSA